MKGNYRTPSWVNRALYYKKCKSLDEIQWKFIWDLWHSIKSHKIRIYNLRYDNAFFPAIRHEKRMLISCIPFMSLAIGMKLIFTSSKIGNLKLDMPKHNSLMAMHYVYSLDNVQSRIGNPIRTTSPHFFLLWYFWSFFSVTYISKTLTLPKLNYSLEANWKYW